MAITIPVVRLLLACCLAAAAAVVVTAQPPEPKTLDSAAISAHHNQHKQHSHHHAGESHQQHQQHHRQPVDPDQTQPLLIVIFDGFRHDYLELYRARGVRLPNFEQFASEGVRATRVKNIYPTETLPNHQSLVTGLYAESHGYILNAFQDPAEPGQVMSLFDQASLNDPVWSRGWPEPLWVTNQRQGGRSGVVLYPNSDVPFNGTLPFVQVDQYAILNNNTVRYPYRRRVERILQWLRNPQLYSLNLALLYFDEPDHTGHLTGHLSDQVANQLRDLDARLGDLLGGLRTSGLLDRTNIILTSDHGMTTGNASNLVDLDRIVRPDWYDNVLSDRANIHLYVVPKPGRADDILAAVAAAGLPHLHASAGAHLPEWMRLAGCRRVPPVYLYTDAPYVIVVGGLPPSPPARYGVHGYDNRDQDMWPLWLARGPAFRSGGALVTDRVESVDLYPLACRLLGIRPNPSNGSLERISPVLSPDWLPPSLKAAAATTTLAMLVATATAALLCCLLAAGVAALAMVRSRGRRSDADGGGGGGQGSGKKYRRLDEIDGGATVST